MYKSIDTLPYKIFIKIIETGLVYLLSNEQRESEEFTVIEIQEYSKVWNKIYNEYLEIKLDDNDLRILNINKEIEYLEAKYSHIKMIVECLIFDWNQELVEIILQYGFKLSEVNYYVDLENILRESESIVSNIEMFKSQLPKQNKQKKEKVNIDFVLASYSAILGIDFDYNTASVTKVLGLQMQVDAKIKSLENN